MFCRDASKSDKDRVHFFLNVVMWIVDTNHQKSHSFFVRISCRLLNCVFFRILNLITEDERMAKSVLRRFTFFVCAAILVRYEINRQQLL